jgi:hypothetical protein
MDPERALAELADAWLASQRRFGCAALLSRSGWFGAWGACDEPDGLRAIAWAVAASGRVLELADAEEEGRSMACYAGSYSVYAVPDPAGVLLLQSELIGPFSAGERAAAAALLAEAAPWLEAMRPD